MPTEEEIRKIRTHAVWEEAKLDLDLEWDTFDVVICRDWLEPRTGHGFPVARIKESWESAKRLDLKPRQTYGNLAFDIGKTRLVTSADKQCVITYFLES
jgi:hypothetical protein